MKDYIKEVVNERFSLQDNTNLMREYIQKYLLYILYKKKLYKNLIFVGGTALRFLYNIKRFSEDLDFSLSCRAKDYDFGNTLDIIEEEFTSSNYQIEIKYDMEKTVHTAFFRFPELLFECGLSSYKAEKISIKIEIDTNPPQGGREEVTLYKVYFHVLYSSL